MPEFLQLIENWNGYAPVSKARFSESDVAGVLDLISNRDRMPAHRHEFMLREAITTSDFPELFGFTLEREILARYRVITADWRAYCAVGTLPNFNAAEMHKVQGNDTLLPLVAQKGEYLVSPVTQAKYSRQVFKRGRQFDISWEALINDALSAFSSIPERFAEAVTYTRAYNVTDLHTSVTGPDTGLYGTPIADVDGQNVTNLGALALTIANLETTMQLMSAQTDVNGRPLGIRGKHLVVPPALEFAARAILTSALKQWTEVGAGGGIPVPTANVVPQMGLQLHVDPLLPVIDASGDVNTTWYLFADPSSGKAIQMDFLRGHEDPEIAMKASDKVSVGGGSINPFDGDFATDNIFYRVRDVHGGAKLDPRYTYAQIG
jgi:hypothetical protein